MTPAIDKSDTIEAMIRQLGEVFNDLRADPSSIKTASAAANVASKRIAGVKIMLTYHQMRGEEPNIAFMRPESPVKKIAAKKARQ